MADKKKLSGWMRLWIVGSSLWSLFWLLVIEPWRNTDIANPMSFLEYGLLPCLGTFLLGKAAGWIYRGFDEDFRQRIGGPEGESGQPGEPRRNVSLVRAAVSVVRRLFF